MINIADQLHAATADGVLANASEIKDGTKTQSQINAEVQAALAQAGNTEKIQQIVDTARNDVLGLVVKNCGEDIPGAILGDIYQDINGDGEFLGDFSEMVPPSDFGVGSVVKAADMQDSQEAMFYVAKTAASPSIKYDGESYSVEGVTEWLEVEKGKIYECTARKAISYTPEGEDAITGYLYLYDEVKVSLKDIDDAIGTLAKEVTAVDADILSGKMHIASAITSKGVTSSVSDSLVAMASKVLQIPQELNTDTSDFEQMIVPMPYMWNVYSVAEDLMKQEIPSYIPSYMEVKKLGYGANSFFVGEYYLGYSTLELLGADGYLRCDGDFYAIANGVVTHTLPDGSEETYEATSIIHTWHDVANSMANRWVAFFFLNDSYSFVNLSNDICPRRVAIAGICNSFVVSAENRLTDVWVIGTLGNFQGGTTGNTWNPAQVIQHYPVHATGTMYQSFGGQSLVLPDLETLTGSGELFRNGSYLPTVIYLPKLTTFNSSVAMFLSRTANNFQYGLTDLLIPNIKEINTTLFGLTGQHNFVFNSLKHIFLDSLETINITQQGNVYVNRGGAIMSNPYQLSVFTNVETLYMPNLTRVTAGWILYLDHTRSLGYSFQNLIDITVGEMVTNLDLRYWYPRLVLNDASKKIQLVENIKNHILARVSDAQGGTQLVFTISTNMYNAISGETIEWQGETMTLADAFLTKNWLLAGA